MLPNNFPQITILSIMVLPLMHPKRMISKNLLLAQHPLNVFSKCPPPTIMLTFANASQGMTKTNQGKF
jgi:hypothetical protein